MADSYDRRPRGGGGGRGGFNPRKRRYNGWRISSFDGCDGEASLGVELYIG